MKTSVETINGKLCTVVDCVNPHKTKGLCGKHYMRLLRNKGMSDPVCKMPMPERLLNKRYINENNCWVFTGSLEDGYGRISYNGRLFRAHQLSYLFFVGQIPGGRIIRHKCDNRACFNPDHLDTGTNRDNINDMLERGRSPRGEDKASSKLTEDQVIDMRLRYKNRESMNSLAKEYGVHRSTARDIIRGKWWKHLPHATINGERCEIAITEK